jgi:hypothetical protein
MQEKPLVKLGKEAEVPQDARMSKKDQKKAGRAAMAAVVAGGAVAASVLATRELARKHILNGEPLATK